MWVFFAGYGNCGKDTAADFLVNRYGFTKLAFADGVRDKANEENRFFPELNETYKDVVNRLGYEDAKKHQCVRDYLVEIGEGTRKKCGDDVWVNMLNERAKNRPNGGLSLPLVVSDCRQSNEAEYGKTRGCVLILLKRDGCLPKHTTEKESIEKLIPDCVIENNGSKVEFFCEIDRILSLYDGKRKCGYVDSDVCLCTDEIINWGVY